MNSHTIARVAAVLLAACPTLSAQTMSCNGPHCIMCAPGNCQPTVTANETDHTPPCRPPNLNCNGQSACMISLTGASGVNGPCYGDIWEDRSYDVKWPDASTTVNYAVPAVSTPLGVAGTWSQCSGGNIVGPETYGECWPIVQYPKVVDGYFQVTAANQGMNYWNDLCGKLSRALATIYAFWDPLEPAIEITNTAFQVIGVAMEQATGAYCTASSPLYIIYQAHQCCSGECSGG